MKTPEKDRDPAGGEVVRSNSNLHNDSTTPNPTMLLAAALTLAEHGFSVIAVRGKKAAGKWKHAQSKRATEAELRANFFKRGITGLAIVCGDVSGGLACRDFDVMEAYEAWAEAHPDLASTLPTVQTRRGRHVWFCSSVAGLGIIGLGDGELRASGCYALLPPSRFADGSGRYEWLVRMPNGPLPLIDPFECGLANRCEQRLTENTEPPERTESTETTEEYRDTEAITGSVLDSILSTLPTGIAQRNRKLFDFARALKGLPDYADADVRELRPIVKAWHERALPVIGTKPFDDTWSEFVRAWRRVKFPAGEEPLEKIIAAARNAELPKWAERFDCPTTQLLIRLCRELQRCAGDSPFFLSCRKAGEVLEVDHQTAWKRMGMLVAEGILKLTAAGTTTRAARYYFIEPKES